MRTEVTFWGVRGSIPTPGRQTVKFGGNTSCVAVRSGRGLLVLDGGTGLRVLGPRLRSHRGPIPILITHPHLDHIAGLPFFEPALKKGKRLQIYGPPGLRRALRQLFPFPLLKSRRSIKEISPGSFSVGRFRISCRSTCHPGRTLAYRIVTPTGRTIVYLSDHETGRSDGPLRRWIDRPDLLIIDSQYFDHEYRRHRGWGHSPLSGTVGTALAAGAKKLVLFHHDPAHTDRLIRKKLSLAMKSIARSGKKITLIAAREGQTVLL